MDGLAVSSANNHENNKKDKKRNMTMTDTEAEAGAAAEIKRDEIMALVEEAKAVIVVEEAVVAVEEANEATPSTTMKEEAMAALKEVEEAGEGIMDATTTSTRGINNILSHISNNKCLQQFPYLIPVQYWTTIPEIPHGQLGQSNG